MWGRYWRKMVKRGRVHALTNQAQADGQSGRSPFPGVRRGLNTFRVKTSNHYNAPLGYLLTLQQEVLTLSHKGVNAGWGGSGGSRKESQEHQK